MLATSPSSSPHYSPRNGSVSSSQISPRTRFNCNIHRSSHASPIVKPRSSHVSSSSQQPQQHTHPDPNPQWSQDTERGSSSTTKPSYSSSSPTSRRKMVDAGTQWSPPLGYRSPTALATSKSATSATKIPLPVSPVAHIKIAESIPSQPSAAAAPTVQPHVAMPGVSQRQDHLSLTPEKLAQAPPSSSNAKRHNSDSAHAQFQSSQSSQQPQQQQRTTTSSSPPSPPEPENDDVARELQTQDQGPSKRHRPHEPPDKIMPIKYETCDTRDLVILISSMLMELIRYNDAIPLKDGALTRFHSRAPPGISVRDYLQRLTTHATLSPPILLSMVYYIDKLCALYPAFTISSLTVHRFLITSATVASKGLSDSFWTNKTYSRVGGVTIKELALLELEFLVRVQWRIVPEPEILVQYYRSLVERSPGYEMEKTPPSS